MDKIAIKLTFKKKEIKAILRLLAKIAEEGYEGINRGALELTIQEVEGILDHMKNNGRSIATVVLEVNETDFMQFQSLFEGLADGGPDEGPKDIHDILADEESPARAAWGKPSMGGPCVLNHAHKNQKKPGSDFGTMPIPTCADFEIMPIEVVKKKNDDLDPPRISANTWAEQVAGTHLFGF